MSQISPKILSILILSLPERKDQLQRLLKVLNKQREEFPGAVEILVDDRDRPVTIGTKRNSLLKKAGGRYIQFVDDDDMPGDAYLRTAMQGIESGADVVQLRGNYYENGKFKKIFHHYLACESWHETPDKYHRYPNHLNCMRADIARLFRFDEINHGEDHRWAEKIKNSGLLKTEFATDAITYNYYYVHK